MDNRDRYLITGFSGFVSKHFLDYLEDLKIEVMVTGIDLHLPSFNIEEFNYVKCEFQKVDLLNKAEVENIVSQFKPSYILHLASYSSVAMSW